MKDTLIYLYYSILTGIKRICSPYIIFMSPLLKIFMTLRYANTRDVIPPQKQRRDPRSNRTVSICNTDQDQFSCKDARENLADHQSV